MLADVATGKGKPYKVRFKGIDGDHGNSINNQETEQLDDNRGSASYLSGEEFKEQQYDEFEDSELSHNFSGDNLTDTYDYNDQECFYDDTEDSNDRDDAFEFDFSDEIRETSDLEETDVSGEFSKNFNDVKAGIAHDCDTEMKPSSGDDWKASNLEAYQDSCVNMNLAHSESKKALVQRQNQWYSEVKDIPCALSKQTNAQDSSLRDVSVRNGRSIQKYEGVITNTTFEGSNVVCFSHCKNHSSLSTVQQQTSSQFTSKIPRPVYSYSSHSYVALVMGRMGGNYRGNGLQTQLQPLSYSVQVGG